MSKVSGPLLDRIDIHIEAPSVKYKELANTQEAECSAAIKKRVANTRTIQLERFKNEGIFSNSQMHPKQIKKCCILEEPAKELMRLAMTELGLSARAYDKLLRIARTIADLAGAEVITSEFIFEAIQYRNLDRQLWL